MTRSRDLLFVTVARCPIQFVTITRVITRVTLVCTCLGRTFGGVLGLGPVLGTELGDHLVLLVLLQLALVLSQLPLLLDDDERLLSLLLLPVLSFLLNDSLWLQAHVDLQVHRDEGFVR